MSGFILAPENGVDHLKKSSSWGAIELCTEMAPPLSTILFAAHSEYPADSGQSSSVKLDSPIKKRNAALALSPADGRFKEDTGGQGCPSGSSLLGTQR